MNTLFRDIAETPTASQASGTWYALQWTPDLASNERLNVGVVFQDAETGKQTTKVLDYWERLKCLYGEGVCEQLQFLLQVETSQLEYGLDRPGSPNLQFSEPQLAQGASAEEIVSNLYTRVVTLGRYKEKSKSRSYTVTTQEFEKYVYEELQTRYPFLYSRLTDNPVVIPDGYDDYKIRVSLLTTGLIGNLVSTVYGSEQTAKYHLLEASNRLEAAAGCRKRINNDDELSLFVLLPRKYRSNMTPSEVESLREHLDEQMFRVKMSGIDVIAEEDESLITTKVAEWAEAKVG